MQDLGKAGSGGASSAELSRTSSNVSSYSTNPSVSPSRNITAEAHEDTRRPSSERINPFDKLNTSATSTKGSNIYQYSAATKTDPPKDDEKTLDDIIKDRFNKQQGVRDENTGRYIPPVVSEPSTTTVIPSKPVDTVSDILNKYKTPTTTTTRAEAIKKRDSLPAFSRSESVRSDTEVIFGTSKPDFTQFSGRYSRSGSTDAEIIFGETSARNISKYSYSSRDSQSSTESDNIFTRREDSKSTDRDFATTKAYEGIQNAAFQDFDSPAANTSGSASNTTSSLATAKWSSNLDDDYDLK
ncbi:hypothetical protein DMENIID0001_053300 [Sergentomyia squamirostris]